MGGTFKKIKQMNPNNPRNAGRKPFFNEKTEQIYFKVPESKKEEIRKEVRKIIDRYRK